MVGIAMMMFWYLFLMLRYTFMEEKVKKTVEKFDKLALDRSVGSCVKATFQRFNPKQDPALRLATVREQEAFELRALLVELIDAGREADKLYKKTKKRLAVVEAELATTKERVDTLEKDNEAMKKRMKKDNKAMKKRMDFIEQNFKFGNPPAYTEQAAEETPSEASACSAPSRAESWPSKQPETHISASTATPTTPFPARDSLH